MILIEPSVQLLGTMFCDENEHIARCARVCYASDKTSDADKMVKGLKKRNHNSMFRHATRYYIIKSLAFWHIIKQEFNKCPYVEYAIDEDDKAIYIAANCNYILDKEKEKINIFKMIESYQVDEQTFYNTNKGHELMRYTFKVITQISTSRELNRVSPNNIAEQSTRYVNFDKKGIAFVKPHWYDNGSWRKKFIFRTACKFSEWFYKLMLLVGFKPEDAREVLLLDTATVCVYTYSIKEWRHIIDLRYYGTTGKPHPNAKIIAGKIKDVLMSYTNYYFNDVHQN